MAAGDAVLKPEGQVFVIGTACGAYPVSEVGSAPDGPDTDATPDDTATVASNSTISFSGLDQKQYFCAPSPVDCVQTLTVDATSGNFRLRYGGVDTTAPIKFNVTAANLKAQLLLLPSIGTGQIATVTGGPGDSGGTTPYVITFGGTLAATDVPVLEVLSGVSAQASTALVNVAGGGAAATVALTTPGRPGGDAWVSFLPNTA